MKLAIIGTGYIAGEMVEALQAFEPTCEITTLYNRTHEKAVAFAQKFGISHVSDSFESVLASECEAVYLAVHSNDHFQMTKQALLAGKHVLCEKPAVLNAWEYEQLKTLAQAKGLVWMDAMRFVHLPLWQTIKQVIAAGTIGEIIYIDGSLGRISQRLYRHTPELAGGALYDLAIYPLYACLDLLGKPTAIQAQSIQLASGVDHSVSVQLQYELAMAHVFASCVSQTQTHLRIQGSAGTIMIPEHFTTSGYFQLIASDGVIEKVAVECLGSGMVYEFQDFMKGSTQSELSELVYETLTKIRQQLGIDYPSEQKGE